MSLPTIEVLLRVFEVAAKLLPEIVEAILNDEEAKLDEREILHIGDNGRSLLDEALAAHEKAKVS